METFNINTSQNVTLQFRIASVGDRILAFMLDVVILGISALAVTLTFSQTGIGFSLWMIIFIFPVVFYHFLFESLFNGQSPGKMIMGIRVVKIDGSQLSLGTCFIRWIFRLIDVTLLGGGIAVLLIIISGKGQRLGDMAASTTVLKTSPPIKLDNTVWTDIEESYQPKFVEVDKLTDRDIQIIKEVLNEVEKSGSNYTTSTLLQETRKAIAEKTGIVSDLNNRDFLITVVKDFNAVYQV